jgi:serine/threonine-protein kinase
VVDAPKFNGTAWVAPAPNSLPVTNITALRKTIQFESKKGMSLEAGTLGMSLQTPRALAPSDVTQILGMVGGGPAPPTPAPSEVPRPSQRRVLGGKYEILRQLGAGGMGVVYEARHTGTGRRVAVKEIVGDELRKNPQVVERFEREARATGAIETQHIAAVLDSGVDPATNHSFLVMELLKGEDLHHLIGRLGPLPEDLALRIAAQACVGLVRAHEAGVVHRDIKPANLFLARRDEGEIVVKLLDFGIARVREQLASSENRALTTTGLMLGSPLYMSPEQVVGAKDLDHRTDLWSLGVVLHEALTGRTPYGDVETVGALFVAICSKPARPLGELAPRVSPPVAAIVKKALELDPARRYASAEELLADLKKELPSGTAIDESMLVALPPSEQYASVEPEPIALADTVASEPPTRVRDKP